MTRDEFDFNFEKLGFVGQVELCKVYIKSLEQRIAELEAPKTCDGCVHNRFGSGSDGIAIDCTLMSYACKRGLWKDYYEPKESL